MCVPGLSDGQPDPTTDDPRTRRRRPLLVDSRGAAYAAGRLVAHLRVRPGPRRAVGADEVLAVRPGYEPPRRRADFADRPARPVQAFVAGFDSAGPDMAAMVISWGQSG